MTARVVGAAAVACCLTGAAAGAVTSVPASPPVSGPASGGPDFDADGFPDLAVSSSCDRVAGLECAGRVTVLYGSTGPLGSGDSQVWDQSVEGVVGAPMAFSNFGDALETGDFDSDGFDDLVIGSPHIDVGMVQVFYGSATGLGVRDDQWFAPGRDGLPESGGEDAFGYSFTSADFDGDGYLELVIGARGWSAQWAFEGAVHVLHGGPDGLSTTNALFIDERALGDRVKLPEYFGESLTAGDLNGDGRPELVVGAPLDGYPGQAGAVFVIPFSPEGVDLAAAEKWTGRTPGVPGRPNAVVEFGRAVATGDIDADGVADLAVGGPAGSRVSDPGPNVGAVWIFPGSTGPLIPSGVKRWGQGSPGVLGLPQNGDRSGSTVALADLNGDGFDDLAFGSPDEAVRRPEDRGKNNAGAVSVLYGSESGLSAEGDQLLTQNSRGVPDRPQNADQFGTSMGSADLDADGYDDLLVGAPWDGGQRMHGSGAAFVFYGTDEGLRGALMLRQGEAGVPGPATPYAYFGWSFGVSSAGGPGAGAGSSTTARLELSRAAR